MNLSVDIITSILWHLSDFDIFRLCQVDRSMSRLRNKDKVWHMLWRQRYPNNEVMPELTMYQNFLRLVLVKKFLELNAKLLKGWYGDYVKHSETPQRRLDRAMFIPMVGYNYSEHDHCNTKILPDSLKRAFASVNCRLPEMPKNCHGKEVVFANWLLETDNLMVRPKKGDVLTFLESSWDYCQCLFIYNGKTLQYNWGVDTSSFLSNIDMNWPTVPIDYWESGAIVPAEIKEQFEKNLTFEPVPNELKTILTPIEVNVYSFCQLDGITLYLLFDLGFKDVAEYPFEVIWDDNRLQSYNDEFGYGTTLFWVFGLHNGLQYIVFRDPLRY